MLDWAAEFAAAPTTAPTATPAATPPHWPLLAAFGALQLGRCLTALGRTEEGLALQKDAIAAYQTMAVSNPHDLVTVADTCRRAGRLDEGLPALEE